MTRETVTGLLADRIKQARSERGWTAQRLADECAAAGSPTLTRGTIAKIESGARKAVTAEEVAVLAFVLALTPTDLLDTPEWPFERRGAGRSAPPPEKPRLHLLIAVEPDALDPGRVNASSWRQDESDVWPPARGETLAMPIDALERHVAELITQAEVAWSDREAQVTLEFLLPQQLMHLPVHRWSQEPGSPAGRPLELDYAVSVRSLERMRGRQWHRRWRSRWEGLLADPSPERIYFVGPRDLEEQWRLDAILSDPRWTAAVLAGAPAAEAPPRGPDQLQTALRAGLPALLWHPRADAGAMQEFVMSLVGGDGVADLPSRVKAARLKGYELDAAFADITRDLVLLWDDPSRIVFGDDPTWTHAGAR